MTPFAAHLSWKNDWLCHLGRSKAFAIEHCSRNFVIHLCDFLRLGRGSWIWQISGSACCPVMTHSDMPSGCHSITGYFNFTHLQHFFLADMDEHVADSPYQVMVLPGLPSAQHSVVDGPGRRAAVVGTEASFEVEARDAHGNRCVPDLSLVLPNPY